MPYKLEKLPGEPVLVFTIWGDFDLAKNQAQIAQKVAQLIAEIDGDYYMIDDYSGLSNVNFGDMVAVMAEQSKQDLTGSVNDPRAHHVLVGSNSLIEFAAKSFNQEQYGGVALPIFTSLDDALNHVRNH